jgi:hypothetical protein
MTHVDLDKYVVSYFCMPWEAGGDGKRHYGSLKVCLVDGLDSEQQIRETTRVAV